MSLKGKLALGSGKVAKVASVSQVAPSMRVVSDPGTPVEVVFAKPEAQVSKPTATKATKLGAKPVAVPPVDLPANSRNHIADELEFDEVDPRLYKAPVVQETKLSGVTFSGYDFASLRVGQRVWLIPDPYGAVVKPVEGHPDPNAISVQDQPRGGAHIGYIPAKMAQVVAWHLRDNVDMPVEANITNIKGGGTFFNVKTGQEEQLNYGVDIVIRFYEERA